jgi:hypothetical protein
MTEMQLESDPVACTVCEAVVAKFSDQGLAAALTVHDEKCAGHGMTGCAHTGPCYRKVTEHTNGGRA